MKIVSIIPGAGSGKRYGDVAKAFLEIGGRPVISWVFDVLEGMDEISEIIPVLREVDMEKGLRLVEERGYRKIKRIAPGGGERQDSVFHALNLISDADAVIVHDAVRPAANPELFRKVIENLKGVDGVITGLPLTDTIKEVESSMVLRTLNRERYWSIQTPQIFRFRSIKEAYKKAMRESKYFTDDSSVVEYYGGKIKVVTGSYENIKITYPSDLRIIETFLGVL